MDTSRRNPADSRSYLWSPAEHSPCLNWICGREGCNGRHFLPQCPLPHPAGAVTLTTEDTPEPAPELHIATAPATAQDFSALFMGGPREILCSQDPTAGLSVVAVTTDDVVDFLEHMSTCGTTSLRLESSRRAMLLSTPPATRLSPRTFMIDIYDVPRAPCP